VTETAGKKTLSFLNRTYLRKTKVKKIERSPKRARPGRQGPSQKRRGSRAKGQRKRSAHQKNGVDDRRSRGNIARSAAEKSKGLRKGERLPRTREGEETSFNF